MTNKKALDLCKKLINADDVFIDTKRYIGSFLKSKKMKWVLMPNDAGFSLIPLVIMGESEYWLEDGKISINDFRDVMIVRKAVNDKCQKLHIKQIEFLMNKQNIEIQK